MEARSRMKQLPFVSILAPLAIAVGCQQPTQPLVTHKLVVTGNQHEVPVYRDEEDYVHTSLLKGSGGVDGIVGDVKQTLTAKQIDDQTPVQVVSSDDNGAVIAVTNGPMKGLTGFVAKQNID
jgi:hypothetical protein